MALVRVAQYGSTPGPVTDYQAQNAHLQAFTNQLMTQQFILDAGTAKPVIKQGTYISHGGSLYVADADTDITGSPSDGSVYIRVSGTTSLTVEFITDISGYAWNPVYTALTDGGYTLLPYLIVKAGTVWTRYNFNPNNQQFGSLTVTGAISGAECITTNGPNKPFDNTSAIMPEVGIGGFTYASSVYPTANSFAKIWIPNTGIFIVHIEFDATTTASTSPSTPVLQFTTRQDGGYSVEITQEAPAGSQLRAWAMRLV